MRAVGSPGKLIPISSRHLSSEWGGGALIFNVSRKYSFLWFLEKEPINDWSCVGILE